jgi:hypothetical protein
VLEEGGQSVYRAALLPMRIARRVSRRRIKFLPKFAVSYPGSGYRSKLKAPMAMNPSPTHSFGLLKAGQAEPETRRGRY